MIARSPRPLRLASAHAILAAGVLLLGALPGHRPGHDAEFSVFVSNEHEGTVAELRGSTGELLRTFPVGQRPRGIHVSNDGRTLYVATSGSPRMGPGADPDRAARPATDRSADGIAILDTRNGELIRRLQVGSDPEEFALTRDERRIVVANEDIGEASLWELPGGRLVARAAVSGEPEGVVLHPRQDLVYVTCEEEGDIFVLSATDGKRIAQLNLGGRPRTVAFSSDGTRAYVPLETKSAIAIIDAHQHRLLKTVAVPPPALPMGAAISPDDREVYVSTGRGNSVVVLDTRSEEIVARIEVGLRPWGVALSPDGKTLFTANGGSGDVSLIDVAARREVRRVKVGAGPWGVAIGRLNAP